MDKEKQERLNLNLEKALRNIKGYEIGLVENYIGAFEEYGYDVTYFKNKIKIIKAEKYLIKKTIRKEIKVPYMILNNIKENFGIRN